MMTLEQLKSKLLYDKDTGYFKYKNNTAYHKEGELILKKDKYGYIVVSVCGKSYLAHRLAWFYVFGYWAKEQIDHINGVRDDNRIENLRESTQTQNKQNIRKPYSNGSSGYLGVTYHIRKGKWMAQIQHMKKNIYIGIFKTKEEAYEAYLNKKRELHEYCTI